jgi:hypothetical protein
MKRILKFIKLPRADKILFAEALLIVISVALVLRFVPFRIFKAALSKRLTVEIKNAPADWAQINKIVSSVGFCSRFIPFTSCLTSALAAMLMMRRKGQHSVLRIGVTRNAEQKFKAHAWLETNGRIIIGRLTTHREYTVLDSYFG